MAHLNFVIPHARDDLLSHGDARYFVKNLVHAKDIPGRVKDARSSLKRDGIDFVVVHYFDTYFSVLHNEGTLSVHLLLQVYEDLHQGLLVLNETVPLVLENGEECLDEETKLKWCNVIKMHLYLYRNVLDAIERKVESQRDAGGKRKGKKKEEAAIDKKRVLVAIDHLMQNDLAIFWDPPIIEEAFVNMIAELCYSFLVQTASSATKSNREIRSDIFYTLGGLVTRYDYGTRFVSRTMKVVESRESLVQCIAEGIATLVGRFNCRGFVHDFCVEIVESLTDEQFRDNQGGKNCAQLLTELGTSMPDVMFEEMHHLAEYLRSDPYTLRIAVLNVMKQVVLKVLSEPELSSSSSTEKRRARDDLLDALQAHTADTCAYVRSKSFQNLIALHEANAIPVDRQIQIVRVATMHLRDKTSNVRKSAIDCVTTFLSHNVYGAKLRLSEMKAQWIHRKTTLDKLCNRSTPNNFQLLKDDLRKAIVCRLQRDDDGDDDDDETAENLLGETVYLHVAEGRYDEAVSMCLRAAATLDLPTSSSSTPEDRVELYLNLLETIYVSEAPKRLPDDASEVDVAEADLLASRIKFYQHAIEFLVAIDGAIEPMCDLLESSTPGDMHEAVKFFVTAYGFEVENAFRGVLGMVKMMRIDEREYKEAALDGLKSIYLTTDCGTSRQHSTLIVERLVDLVQQIPYTHLLDFRTLMAEWAAKCYLGNDAIDVLWKRFTETKSRAALQLLGLAAYGKRTIISRNVKVVTSIVFGGGGGGGGGGDDDILLVKVACDALQSFACEKQKITDEHPPPKIKWDDRMWTDLVDFMIGNFDRGSEFYNQMSSSAVQLIYKVCSKPIRVGDTLLRKIRDKLPPKSDRRPAYLLTQFVHVLGEMALGQRVYLEVCVSKELQRRNYTREQRKKTKKKKKTGSPKKANDTVAEESMLMDGAGADDIDSEYIENVLENDVVTADGGLGRFAGSIVEIVADPDGYDHVMIQGTAIVALLRYMLVSSKFCKDQMRLVFTVLEKSAYPDVKCNILLHCPDLMQKFPNIVEPWTPKLFERLRDDDAEVRRNTSDTLSKLILRDMMLVNVRIAEMARTMVDEEPSVRQSSKNFFAALSRKPNSLYNVLPDIFSHLAEQSDLKQADFRSIMSYLFGLIDKSTHRESLVNRFCGKFRSVDDDDDDRIGNIAYCISLIRFSDRAIDKLIENFDCYKSHLYNEELYRVLKTLVASFTKAGKESGATLEKMIDSVFDVGLEGSSATAGTSKAPVAKGKALKKHRRKNVC